MVVSEESDSESQSESDSDLELKLDSRADSEVLGYVPVLATPDSGCTSVPDFKFKLAFRRAWSIEAFEYDCTAVTADSADWDWTVQLEVALLLD